MRLPGHTEFYEAVPLPGHTKRQIIYLKIHFFKQYHLSETVHLKEKRTCADTPSTQQNDSLSISTTAT
jgi:hypothetical protein